MYVVNLISLYQSINSNYIPVWFQINYSCSYFNVLRWRVAPKATFSAIAKFNEFFILDVSSDEVVSVIMAWKTDLNVVLNHGFSQSSIETRTANFYVTWRITFSYVPSSGPMIKDFNKFRNRNVNERYALYLVDLQLILNRLVLFVKPFDLIRFNTSPREPITRATWVLRVKHPYKSKDLIAFNIIYSQVIVCSSATYICETVIVGHV